MSEVFNQTKEIVKTFLEQDSSGHDYSHVERVFNSAMHIQKSEGGDPEVIGVAALMHDLCRPWEKKTGNPHFGEEALKIIAEQLERVDLNQGSLIQILDIISKHDIYDWTEKDEDKSIELQIVQDADNLDAIGAVGVGRAFMFGGAHGRPMYISGENLDFSEDYVDDINNLTSTIAHFYEKLLKLGKNMNTVTGRKLAQDRHDFMEQFVEKFLAEWNGSK